MPPPIPPELWTQIRSAYIEGSDAETYAKLAQRFGVSKASVEARASSRTGENWGALRSAYRESQSVNEGSITVSAPQQVEGELLDKTFRAESTQPIDLPRLNEMIDIVLARCEGELREAPARSFERCVDVFIKLAELRLRLRPPSPGQWAVIGVNQFGMSPEDLVASIKLEWESSK